MAAPSSTNPDLLISLKVNYDGVTKKLRMPIRDLGASSIENKVTIPSSICTEAQQALPIAHYPLLMPPFGLCAQEQPC